MEAPAFVLGVDEPPPIFAAIGLALLALGLVRTSAEHLLRICGWIVFGGYLLAKAPWFWGEGDPFNAVVHFAVPGLLAYVIWSEWRTRASEHTSPSLRWLAGAVSVATLTYLALSEIPPLTRAVIDSGAWMSAATVRWLFRAPAEVRTDPHGEVSLWVAGRFSLVYLLNCSAAKGFCVLIGVVAFVPAPWRARLRGMLLCALPIVPFNAFRVAAIGWGHAVVRANPFGWGPADSGSVFWRPFPTEELGCYEFVHGVVATSIALAVHLALLLLAFRLLPQLAGALRGLFEAHRSAPEVC